MSVRAKVHYKEVYRDVEIQAEYTDTPDLFIMSKMAAILRRVRELIDFHRDKLEERQRRKLLKPYVGVSWTAITHIQDLMKE